MFKKLMVSLLMVSFFLSINPLCQATTVGVGNNTRVSDRRYVNFQKQKLRARKKKCLELRGEVQGLIDVWNRLNAIHDNGNLATRLWILIAFYLNSALNEAAAVGEKYCSEPDSHY